jgi:monoamine oxidase
MLEVVAMLEEVSRRGLIGGAGAALFTLATDSLATRVEAATLQGSIPRRVDTVVVGGGIAGLVAARQVADSGRSVLVVEARRRVGGRVLNHHLDSGGTIEAGGAFVGPTQDHILALADELGVPTFPEYDEGKGVYISRAGRRSTFTGTVPPDPTILVDAALLVTRLNRWAAEVPVDAPWKHRRAAEWDSQTLGEYVRKSTLNKGGILELLKSWTNPTFGADPDQLSLLFVIHYIACSGNEDHVGTFERNSDTANGAQERRFVGGSQLIPLKLARQLGDHVALDAAVSRIDQSDERAVVHTSRGRISCRKVIVTATPPLVLDMDWHPQLPARRRALLSHMHMGELMKCDAVYPTPFWRDSGLKGFGINSHSGAVRVSFDNTPPDGTPGVLLAFVGGSTWRTYGTMSLDARRTAVLEGFAALFGEQALHPIEYTERDWTRERWTGGGPVAIMAPRTLTSYGSEIRQPFGRVHWAGTETSTYWNGYMDGAVRSGKRAAAEVVGR